MSKFDNDKECRILLDWLLSHDNLSCLDIRNHLIISGFDFPSNLASSYAFFTHCYVYKHNQNVERVIVVLQSMIISQFMEFYNFYPCINSDGLFGYSCSSRQGIE